MHCKIFFSFLLSLFIINTYGQSNTKTLLFIGTYTGGKPDKGIYVYEFNTTTGAFKAVSHTENITNPSFLTLSPNGKYAYACTDTKMPGAGSVTAFKIDSVHGKLILVNKQASGGENPVNLTVYKNNRFVVNGNYTGGSVSVFKTNADGSLNPYTQLIQFSDSSINKSRQEKAHIHSTVFSPDNKYIFLPDLGSDKIRAFTFDANKPEPLIPEDKLTVHTIPGSGPRHFTFHPNGKFAYCIEELSGMVSAYSYVNGKLDSIQRIFSYSKPQEAYSGADIHVSPDGLFLYASNRDGTENTLSVFAVDPITGKLSLVGHQATYGIHPRNFCIAPGGLFVLVANASTNNIVFFKRDVKTGLLTKMKDEIEVPRPSCLQMRVYKN
jgi:6-phosphogluconolactonase